MLDGEAPAHAFACAVDRLTRNGGIGAGEVDPFEDAATRLFGHEGVQAARAVAIDDQHLARLDVADKLGLDELEGAGFRRYHPSVFLVPPQGQRSYAERIAHGNQGGLGEEGQRIGSVHRA